MAEEKEKTFYFIKASTDFILQNLELKKLRRTNSEYVFIYFKLLAESLETEGHIYFKGSLDDYSDDFELLFNEKADNVKNTILECNKLELIDIEDGHLYFNQVPDLTAKETESARKKRNQRAKKKAMEAAKAAAGSKSQDDDKEDPYAKGDNVRTMGGQCPDNVKKCPTEYRSKELIINTNKLITNTLLSKVKKEVKERKEESTTALSETIIMPFVDYQRVINSFLKYWPGHRIRDITSAEDLRDEEKAMIRSLLTVYSYDEIDEAFKLASENPFLAGEVSDNGKPFIMQFNWIIKPSTVEGIYGGRYNRAFTSKKQQFEESGTDYGSMEELLLENF